MLSPWLPKEKIWDKSCCEGIKAKCFRPKSFLRQWFTGSYLCYDILFRLPIESEQILDHVLQRNHKLTLEILQDLLLLIPTIPSLPHPREQTNYFQNTGTIMPRNNRRKLPSFPSVSFWIPVRDSFSRLLPSGQSVLTLACGARVLWGTLSTTMTSKWCYFSSFFIGGSADLRILKCSNNFTAWSVFLPSLLETNTKGRFFLLQNSVTSSTETFDSSAKSDLVPTITAV